MRVLVAMSGGVDSSTAAAILKNEGHDVGGIHMRLHDTNSDNPKSCCGQKDARDAALAASEIGIPFIVKDLREVFKNTIIRNFLAEYEAGRTPIPCTHCNGVLKFSLLVALARQLNYDYIATGHYAYKPTADSHIYQASNSEKDQSYFLWTIKKEMLGNIIFPLGKMSKEEVRQEARAIDLAVADKPESMDVCFVGENKNHKSYLLNHTNRSPGVFINKANDEILGNYENHSLYTVGQRKGLGLNGLWYVTKIDTKNNKIYVERDRTSLYTSTLKLVNTNFLTEVPDGIKCLIRTRHRTPLVEALFRDNTLITEEPVISSPGQAAVLYSHTGQLLGGGWLTQDKT